MLSLTMLFHDVVNSCHWYVSKEPEVSTVKDADPSPALTVPGETGWAAMAGGALT
jgi:hypothetical protein